MWVVSSTVGVQPLRPSSKEVGGSASTVSSSESASGSRPSARPNQAAHPALAGRGADGPAHAGRVEAEVQAVGDGGGAGDPRRRVVGGAEAVLDRGHRGRRRGGADVVGEGVEVSVRGEDADALDLGAVLAYWKSVACPVERVRPVRTVSVRITAGPPARTA
ncbi:hypothetical protein BLIC30S_01842 [Bacillus licheniformis]